MKNEDCFGYSKNRFVLVDGATDVNGEKYDGRTGGEIVSRLVVDECLSTHLSGIELVEHLNSQVADLYKNFGIGETIMEGLRREVMEEVGCKI